MRLHLMRPYRQWINLTMASVFALMAPMGYSRAAQADILPLSRPLVPAVPFTSDDPNVNTNLDYCQGFEKESFSVDGQSVMRYPLAELKYVHCVKSGQPIAPWIVQKTAWDFEDQKNWETFIHNFGMAIEEGRCGTFDSCMISSANMYHNEFDDQALQYTDCGKFPEYLRAYFSFRNHLPFSFVYQLTPNPLTPEQQAQSAKELAAATARGQKDLDLFLATESDIRYARNGMVPVKRVNIPQRTGVVSRDFFSSAKDLLDGVSTATYRMFQPPSTVLPDFYSPAFTPQTIRPGTVVYAADGHAGLVYDIRENGQIMTMAAHPGNTVSARPLQDEFGTFERSNPNHGAGFKNFRPFELKNPIIGYGKHKGQIVGGEIVFKTDQEIPDFSAEQYYGTIPDPSGRWSAGPLMYNNHKVDWQFFIKLGVTGGTYKEDPLQEFRNDLSGLCSDLQGRMPIVQQALGAHAGGPVAFLPHPAMLPANIYGADGDWETFSSPGRDLRLRDESLSIIHNLRSYMDNFSHPGKSPYFYYQGTNLKADLQQIYAEVDKSCVISYNNSAGANVTIPSLSLAITRLPKISYDPYDCPELRWGAKRKAELSTCRNDDEKMQWYVSQQFLRNQTVRDPKELMGWDLPTLKSVADQEDSSVNAKQYDILSALEAL